MTSPRDAVTAALARGRDGHTVSQLCRACGLDRTAVRAALGELAAEGRLSRALLVDGALVERWSLARKPEVVAPREPEPHDVVSLEEDAAA